MQEVGSAWLFQYYYFLREYGREPQDIEDYFDGLASLSIIKQYDAIRVLM